MAIQLSDQFKASQIDAQGRTHRLSTSEKYGKVTSFNITLNSSGSYPQGTTPANVTFNGGDIVQLIDVKTNDKIRSIKLLNAQADAGITFNVGLAFGVVSNLNPISGTPNAQPGTIANATAYASSDADIQAAHLAPVELAWLNRVPGAANQFVWQDAGLSENPGGTMYLVLEVTGNWTIDPDQVAFLVDVINY